MVNPLILVGAVFFSFFILFIIFITTYSNKKFQSLHWFLSSLVIFNGLGFTFVIWGTRAGFNIPLWQFYINKYDNYTAVIFLISSILLGLATFFGWKIAGVIKKANKPNMAKINFDYQQYKRYQKKLIFIAWSMLFVSIFSYYLYSKAYGGFVGLLSYSILIRSGVVMINNPYSFLQKFGSFSYFSSYVFFGLLIDKSNKYSNRKSCFLGYIVSFGFSLYVLFSLAGRASTLVYISTFFLGYALHHYRSISKMFKRLILFYIITLVLLPKISFFLRRSSENIGIINLLVKELSFPFASFIIQLNQNSYRFFKDIIFAPLFLLPQKIWSGILKIETATSYNTFVFFGARKGEAGVTSAIPVDLLTFSYMQASIFGVIVIGLLFGALLYYLEIICSKIKIDGVRHVIYANLILNVAILSVLYGDPRHIIVRNFPVIIGLILLKTVSINSKKLEMLPENWTDDKIQREGGA